MTRKKIILGGVGALIILIAASLALAVNQGWLKIGADVMKDWGLMPVEMDSDNDTVPDYKDECPNEAGSAENEGCSETISAAIPAQSECRESDNNLLGRNSGCASIIYNQKLYNDQCYAPTCVGGACEIETSRYDNKKCLLGGDLSGQIYGECSAGLCVRPTETCPADAVVCASEDINRCVAEQAEKDGSIGKAWLDKLRELFSPGDFDAKLKQWRDFSTLADGWSTDGFIEEGYHEGMNPITAAIEAAYNQGQITEEQKEALLLWQVEEGMAALDQIMNQLGLSQDLRNIFNLAFGAFEFQLFLSNIDLDGMRLTLPSITLCQNGNTVVSGTVSVSPRDLSNWGFMITWEWLIR